MLKILNFLDIIFSHLYNDAWIENKNPADKKRKILGDIKKWEEAMEKEYDLFLFCGQSNMAGRGITSEDWPEEAPSITPGAGLEYRAISDPKCLHMVEEPFGGEENNPDGICEPGMKTGSMVTSFINAYYVKTKTPVIGVSASKGGSAICEWQGDRDYLLDALMRLKRAEKYLEDERIRIRHRYLLWCQGETDGDLGTSPENYKALFKKMFFQLKDKGIEACFLITIGEYNGEKGFDYSAIRRAQLELTAELSDVLLVCDDFHIMRSRGLMKDEFHYYQKAYNEVGTAAGTRAGELVNAL